MKSLVSRLKSPVVILQLLTILATAVVFFAPNYSDQVRVVVGTLSATINVVAGLNNPTSTTSF